jgi:putative membrane protein insertion efficiency factor
MLRSILIFPFWLIIKIYQYLISPLTPAACRHLPTCSTYTLEALQRHGTIKGLKLGTNRILRCHPWGTHGFDPVPILVIKKMRLGNWPQYDVLKEKLLFESKSNSPKDQQ